MTRAHVMFVAVLSALVLMGADHRESPIFGISGSSGTVLELEVVSWSWDGADAPDSGLPGRSRSATFVLRDGPDAERLEQWARDRNVLPAARFESEKSGRLLHFVLSGVVVESVEDAGTSASPAIRVTFRFRDVTTEEGAH